MKNLKFEYFAGYFMQWFLKLLFWASIIKLLAQSHLLEQLH
jgi:hypothetical protein